MNNEFKINPYESVGDIRFGMAKDEIMALFGKEPDNISFDYLQRTNMMWDNISIKLNAKELVNDISFVDSKYKIFYKDISVMEGSGALIKLLNKTEKPLNTVGFKVYFAVGIALTGFGKSKEDKTISVFSKELIKLWKE